MTSFNVLGVFQVNPLAVFMVSGFLLQIALLATYGIADLIMGMNLTVVLFVKKFRKYNAMAHFHTFCVALNVYFECL